MKRKQSTSISLVYAYGCGRVLSGIEHAYAEQERNRMLWDRLVDIDRTYEVSILAAASADDDRLVFLRDEIYFAGRALSDAVEARARERKRQRSNAVPSALDEAVHAQQGRLKTAQQEYFARLKAWRQVNSHAIKEFTARRFTAVAEARNQSGLYWGNYNRVIQSFETARGLCMKTGRRLHHADPDRTDGCLTVQIQRTRTGLGAAPHELQDGSFSGLRISAVPEAAYDPATPRGERSRLCQTTVEMRVDSAGNMVRLQCWMHRPLPADCRVKSAQLTWRDGGARGRRWQLALSLALPRADMSHPHADTAVGIDVGWRTKPDGSLRVAYWQGADGMHGELVLPARWMEHVDWIERTRSAIDAKVIEGEANVRRAELRIKGGRSKDLGERREVYRRFARDIAMRYGIVGIEKLDLAAIAFRGEHAQYNGGAQRQRAAVHTLLLEIRHQCAKQGVRMVELAGPSSMQCHQCGTVSRPVDRQRLYWTCEACRVSWDQDANAAVNLMYAAALAESCEATSAACSSRVLPANQQRRNGPARILRRTDARN